MTGCKRGLLVFALLALGPGAASGQPAGEPVPMTPEAFRAFAEGYTLYFERDGRPFGAERFEKGGRVTWQFGDGPCAEGVWRPHGAQACFFYGGAGADEPFEVLCWRMMREGGPVAGAPDGDPGIVARLLGDGPDAGLELRIVRRDRRPLLCGETGPDI